MRLVLGNKVLIIVILLFLGGCKIGSTDVDCSKCDSIVENIYFKGLGYDQVKSMQLIEYNEESKIVKTIDLHVDSLFYQSILKYDSIFIAEEKVSLKTKNNYKLVLNNYNKEYFFKICKFKEKHEYTMFSKNTRCIIDNYNLNGTNIEKDFILIDAIE